MRPITGDIVETCGGMRVKLVAPVNTASAGYWKAVDILDHPHMVPVADLKTRLGRGGIRKASLTSQSVGRCLSENALLRQHRAVGKIAFHPLNADGELFLVGCATAQLAGSVMEWLVRRGYHVAKAGPGPGPGGAKSWQWLKLDGRRLGAR